MATINKRLDGYQLTTAEFTYRLPDCPTWLQIYPWQKYNLAPGFPRLPDFLAFLEQNLDGPLNSARVASARLITPSQLRVFKADKIIH